MKLEMGSLLVLPKLISSEDNHKTTVEVDSAATGR